MYDVRSIYFNDWDTTNTFSNQHRHEGTINALAHSWDSLAEIGNVFGNQSQIWTDFKNLSGWTRTNPNSSNFVRSADQQWWYSQGTDFYEFGEIGAWEDWATTWENVVANADVGDPFDLAGKNALVDQFMQLF